MNFLLFYSKYNSFHSTVYRTVRIQGGAGAREGWQWSYTHTSGVWCIPLQWREGPLITLVEIIGSEIFLICDFFPLFSSISTPGGRTYIYIKPLHAPQLLFLVTIYEGSNDNGLSSKFQRSFVYDISLKLAPSRIKIFRKNALSCVIEEGRHVSKKTCFAIWLLIYR